MTREQKYQLLDLLDELKKEAIESIAEDTDEDVLTLNEMLDNDPDEVYNMDYDDLLRSIDNIIAIIS